MPSIELQNLKYISKLQSHSENHLYANQEENAGTSLNRRKKHRKRKTNVSVKGTTTHSQRAAKLQGLKTLMMSLRRTRPFLVRTPKSL